MIEELREDKSLRRRMIFACLSVAVTMAAIYSIVAYRLSHDLGVESEIQFLDARMTLLFSELEQDGKVEHIENVIRHAFDSSIQPFYLDMESFHTSLHLEEGIDAQLVKLLSNESSNSWQNDTQLPNSQPSYTDHITYDGRHFTWSVKMQSGIRIFAIVESTLINTYLDDIAKRLIVTTGIVFWLALWLALTLAAWISKRVESKNEALRYLVTHDKVTGLPNRLYLIDHLHQLADADSGDVEGALFLIDLDHLKDVNETLGHQAGDTLLASVANLLNTHIPQDQLLVRMGGDEFLLWVPNISISDCRSYANELLSVCNEPIVIDQLSLNIGVTIGVALMPLHAEDVDNAVICANLAMYEAKQSRYGWLIYDDSKGLISITEQRLKYRSELSSALEQKQIEFYYQPKVSLRDGQIIGAEALARWHHQIDGIIPPSVFIPLLEQSGFVKEFGRYVLKSAIERLVICQEQSVMVPIAINLSPYNLLDQGLVAYTQELLSNAKISPKMLEIELTETATSLNLKTISSQLDRFKSIGVKISIDDFGTGMSSLSYISELRVDTIKIDQSFINDMEENENNFSIVSTAIGLAHSFKSEVVAEGVERKEQAELLLSLGCEYAQGYYYSKPIPADDFVRLLKSDQTLPLLTSKT